MEVIRGVVQSFLDAPSDADTNGLLDLRCELCLALIVQVQACTCYIEAATRRRRRGYTCEERPR